MSKEMIFFHVGDLVRFKGLSDIDENSPVMVVRKIVWKTDESGNILTKGNSGSSKILDGLLVQYINSYGVTVSQMVSTKEVFRIELGYLYHLDAAKRAAYEQNNEELAALIQEFKQSVILKYN